MTVDEQLDPTQPPGDGFDAPHHSARQLRAILDAVGEAIISIDDQQRIVLFNNHAEEAFGFLANEVLGKPISMLMPDRYTTSHHADVDVYSRTGTTRRAMGSRGVVTGRRRNGEEFPLEATISRIETDRHRIMTMVGRDVSGRVHDEALRDKALTAALDAKAELELMAAELDRSNQELEQFAAVASHDLQEPLRKIQAFGDRLRRKQADALSSEGLDYLDRMEDAAARMAALIRDLLTLSRVTTRGASFEPVALDAAAREAVSNLEVRIGEVGADFTVTELPVIDADPIQIVQLLQNLFANSLKFHRVGVPLRITVSGKADGDSCEIQVSDNGIGFDNAYAEQIFGVFKRLHGRSEYEGTGIGLATCRKIAERHGGRIQASGQPGVGVTFTITLPVRHREALAA